MNAPDQELLELYLSTGDQPPFAELVRRHLGLVYSAACRITNRPVLAEEVSQIVFTKLARLTSAKTGVTLIVWLHRTTRSIAIDLVRAETRRSKREVIAASLAMNETSIPWERISPVLDQVIDGLTPDERHVVLCRFFEGQSHAEIARSIGVSEDALRMRVNRSLEKIRLVLQKRGITTTASALALVLPAHALVTSVPAGLATSITATAIASFSPSLALIKIGILTMTKKSAFIAATVLLFAGAGTALLITTKTKEQPSLVRAGKLSSKSQLGVNSGDSPSFKSKERPLDKIERSAAEDELVTKYGESRVKLAKRITPSLLDLIGDDGLPAVSEIMNAEARVKDIDYLAEWFDLNTEEKAKIAAAYDKIQTRRKQEYKADVVQLRSNSMTVTERLLAADAFKRGTLSASEYEQLIRSFGPDLLSITRMPDPRVTNLSVEGLLGNEEFVIALKAAVNEPDWAATVDKEIADDAENIAKAQEPEAKREISLDPNNKPTLEELDEFVSASTKAIEGAKTMLNAMQNMKLPSEDAEEK